MTVNIYAELFSLFFLSIFSGISASMIGFGGSIIFHIGFWSLVTLSVFPKNSTLSEVVVFITIASVLIFMVQSFNLRHYIIFQWKYALIYTAATFVASIIGIEVLVRTDNILMTRLLGGVLFVSFLMNVVKDLLQARKSKESVNDETAAVEKNNKINHQKNHDYKGISDIQLSIVKCSSVGQEEEEGEEDSESSSSLKNEIEEEAHPTSRKVPNKKVKKSSIFALKAIPKDLEKYEFNNIYDYLLLVFFSLMSGFLKGLFGAGVLLCLQMFLFIEICNSHKLL